jgi:hypothetical protein
MSQSSKSRFVFLGIRIVCVLLLIGLSFHDLQRRDWRRIIADFGMVVVSVGLAYANKQGQKLAAENMRKAGLNPDRD